MSVVCVFSAPNCGDTQH